MDNKGARITIQLCYISDIISIVYKNVNGELNNFLWQGRCLLQESCDQKSIWKVENNEEEEDRERKEEASLFRRVNEKDENSLLLVEEMEKRKKSHCSVREFDSVKEGKGDRIVAAMMERRVA